MTAKTINHPNPQTPIECPLINVRRDWIDYNGHMNMAFYNVVFDKGVDHVFNGLGIGVDYMSNTNASCFTMEIHVTYAQEVMLDDPLRVTAQLLDADPKRLHLFLQMFHAQKNYLAATMEQMVLHVDLNERRGAPMPESVQANVQTLREAHDKLPIPSQVGSVIGIRRKPSASASTAETENTEGKN